MNFTDSFITTPLPRKWSSFTWALIVRPHLEYACQLWDPYTQCRMISINSSLSRNLIALKLISHRWDASYEELTRLVNVPMLSKRRLYTWSLPKCTRFSMDCATFLTIFYKFNWRIQADWPEHKHCIVLLHGLTIIITHLSPVASELGTH